MECLGMSFPNVFVICFGNPEVYEDIVWEQGDPLPSKAVLDAQILTNLKTKKIIELSKACESSIIGGFRSSALGIEAIYDSELVDQLNLIGAASAVSPMEGFPDGSSGPYAIRPVINDVIQHKRYEMHTYTQLRNVLLDGYYYKLSCLQKFNDKRDYVNDVATTFEEVNQITWQSIEPVIA
jgi:hypothetical protein